MKRRVGALTLAVAIITIVILVIASIVGSIYGETYTREHIYGADWFCAMWAVLAIVGIGFMWVKRLQHRRVLFVFHLAFVFIALGAALTHYFGREGYIHLREGEENNVVIDNRGFLVERLPFDVTLVEFKVENYEETNAVKDYISHIRIEGEDIDISMNNIYWSKGYRFLQNSYDEDLRGSTLGVIYDPWGLVVTYLGYILMMISGVVWVISRDSFFRQVIDSKNISKRYAMPICVVVGLFVVYWIVKYVIGWSEGSLPPVLMSPLLFIHIVIIMSAYGLLAVFFIFGVIGLIKIDKQKEMMRYGKALLYPAVILLAIGIFVGAIWASISWGSYWNWDPKEVWALITLLVYLYPIHYKIDEAKRFHAFAIIAFLTVLITYFGVNYLLGGLHSYA
ncbi:MAG: cytochrome c biogenesis protein CcsA [Bacteroidia bacterium]|nr:cytochrome c biogenesis protein CcsA [Bacteroidia bacterium]